MSLFEKLKAGLKRTRDSVAFAFSGDKLDDDFFEELEESLILADAGADTAMKIVERLRERVKKELILDPEAAKVALREICADMLRPQRPMDFSGKPAVIMMIGVNGAGKTTTTGKLANLYKSQGNNVLIAAADTFRAAAVEQLEVWSRRSGCAMISGASDPSAVIYDAVSAANSRAFDIVICDTAGRLHTKKNLMEELSKMRRTIGKAAPEASVETLLVLDAATGQNAINQAAMFSDAAMVTGIILTKLDGTAKGGAVLAVQEKLSIPVRYVGVGEQMDDLMEFDPDAFADALFQ